MKWMVDIKRKDPRGFLAKDNSGPSIVLKTVALALQDTNWKRER